MYGGSSLNEEVYNMSRDKQTVCTERGQKSCSVLQQILDIFLGLHVHSASSYLTSSLCGLQRLAFSGVSLNSLDSTIEKQVRQNSSRAHSPTLPTAAASSSFAYRLDQYAPRRHCRPQSEKTECRSPIHPECGR